MISAPRWALLEREPNSKIRRRFPGNNPSSLGGPGSAIVAGHISGIAVLEYGSTEILPPIGAMLTRPTSLLPTAPPTQPRTPARNPGVLDPRTLFRPTRLTAGTNFAGRWRRAPRYGRARWIIVNRRQKT